MCVCTCFLCVSLDVYYLDVFTEIAMHRMKKKLNIKIITLINYKLLLLFG